MAMMARGEHLHSSLAGCDTWQEFLVAVISGLTGGTDSTNKSSSDTFNKPASELHQALPSVALAASPYRPAQHLARCTRCDSQVVKAAQDKMSLLEASHAKPRSHSPVKS